jgi:hypothetical protein
MSRVLVTGGPDLVGSVIFQLLTAGREARTKGEGSTRAEAVRATPEPRGVQRGASRSSGTAGRDDDAGRLDVVAGSEFLDDRIRLRE